MLTNMLNSFGRYKRKGYLLNLRERNQSFRKRPRIQVKKCPKIVNIVQIKD